MANLALDARLNRKKMKILFDCRGLEHAEAELAEDQHVTGSATRIAKIRAAEGRAARESDAIVCVSGKLSEFIQSTWQVNASKITVTPCAVDTSISSSVISKRDQIRAELGLTDRFVVAYVGSVRPWQCPQESLRAFHCIRHIERRAHFLVITTDPKAWRRVLIEHHEPNIGQDVTIITLSHSDVPLYLSAADVALLVRAKSLVNFVASPIKFAEYLACGVPVLMTEGVGDYSELVCSSQIGTIVNFDQDDHAICAQLRPWVHCVSSDRHGISRRCIQFADRALSVQSTAKQLEHVYGRLRVLANEQSSLDCEGTANLLT
jgi:glycosyltransferase involved in cell wall biosynthesis